MKEAHVTSVQIFTEVNVQMAVFYAVTLYFIARYQNSGHLTSDCGDLGLFITCNLHEPAATILRLL